MYLRSSWRRLHAERTVVVRDRGAVPEARQRFAGGVDARAEERPEELVRHDAVVAEPEGMRTVQRARPGVAGEAGVQAELPAELVAEVREDRVLVGGVHRPERDVVDQLLAAHPALEEDHDPVREDVVAEVDRTLVAEVVGEDLVVVVLVHVARHRVGADRRARRTRCDRRGIRRPGRRRPRSRPSAAWACAKSRAARPAAGRAAGHDGGLNSRRGAGCLGRRRRRLDRDRTL